MELSGLFMSQDFISLLEEDFYTHHGKYIPKLKQLKRFFL